MALNPMYRPQVSLLETQQAFAPSPVVLEAAVRRAVQTGSVTEVVAMAAEAGVASAATAPTTPNQWGLALKVAAGIGGTAAAFYAAYRLWNKNDTKPADGVADGIAVQPAIRANADGSDGGMPVVVISDRDGITWVSLSRDPSATAAALAVATMPPLSEAARLAANLRSPDRAVHNRAADDARKFRGRADALVPLIEQILNDPSLPWSVHKAALEALCNLGEDAAPATESILKALHHPDARVREVIPSVFKAMGKEAAAALPHLKHLLLTQDGSWSLRIWVLNCVALMHASVPDADALIPIALNDSYSEVRLKAAALLNRLTLAELWAIMSGLEGVHDTREAALVRITLRARFWDVMTGLVFGHDPDARVHFDQLLPLLARPFVGDVLADLIRYCLAYRSIEGISIKWMPHLKPALDRTSLVAPHLPILRDLVRVYATE